MATSRIKVLTLGDGDFLVARGGEVYRRGPAGATPGIVKSGETVTASEICEWIAFGVRVDIIANATGA